MNWLCITFLQRCGQVETGSTGLVATAMRYCFVVWRENAIGAYLCIRRCAPEERWYHTSALSIQCLGRFLHDQIKLFPLFCFCVLLPHLLCFKHCNTKFATAHENEWNDNLLAVACTGSVDSFTLSRPGLMQITSCFCHDYEYEEHRALVHCVYIRAKTYEWAFNYKAYEALYPSPQHTICTIVKMEMIIFDP